MISLQGGDSVTARWYTDLPVLEQNELESQETPQVCRSRYRAFSLGDCLFPACIYCYSIFHKNPKIKKNFKAS